MNEYLTSGVITTVGVVWVGLTACTRTDSRQRGDCGEP